MMDFLRKHWLEMLIFAILTMIALFSFLMAYCDYKSTMLYADHYKQFVEMWRAVR